MIKKSKMPMYLWIFIVLSIIMFISLFFGGLFFVSSITIWTFCCFYCIYKTFFKDFDITLSDMIKYNEDKVIEMEHENRPFSSIIYAIALPMCFVGMLFLIIYLLVLWFML